MGKLWLFFRDFAGHWQWERHEGGPSPTSSSRSAFADSTSCVRDAIQHRYRPTLDQAMYPPDFEVVPWSATETHTSELEDLPEARAGGESLPAEPRRRS